MGQLVACCGSGWTHEPAVCLPWFKWLSAGWDVPVHVPGWPADGSLGDMLFFHSYKNPGLVLDIVQVSECSMPQPGQLSLR